MLRNACRISLASFLILLTLPALASDWPSWRGPFQTGVATEAGLVTDWSKDGDNLLWRADFSGRSTPVVFDGRVCANGRVGEGVTQQERIACWNAETGKLLWERRFNVYHTTVPYNRVGWGSVTADPETGNVYAQNVDGRLVALDKNGETVWERRLGEEVGRKEGYGGRTHTPVIDEDRLIISVISSSWGAFGPPRHRYYAFDKRTGEIQWLTTVGERVYDFNTYSTPVITVIDGQRLLIGGTAGGHIAALKSRTGEIVWTFELSKRGINASVAVDGNRVYASHSEENVDSGIMGRVVAIDATGQGDITKTGELWRVDQMTAGYASPLVHEGEVYVVDNSANLHVYDGKSGTQRWEHNFGTVGKGSPVWADGRIYLTEVNGNFVIIEPPAAPGEAAETVSEVHLQVPDGRYAEIYGSPAIAYGRIYFVTEEGVYCVGKKGAPFTATASEPVVLGEPPVAANEAPAHLQVVPAEIIADAGAPVHFTARAYDAKGRFLRTVEAQWSLKGLEGQIGTDGALNTSPKDGSQVGFVVAKLGDLEGEARVRLGGPLPWSEDFEGLEEGKAPAHWIGGFGKIKVAAVEGEGKVLNVPRAARGVPRAMVYMGPETMSGYTVQADVQGTQQGRRRPDVGLINSGYVLDIQGNHQRIQVRSWAAMLRMAKTEDFAWDMDAWYTMKMRVDQQGGKAVIRGKVWKRGDPEPAEWTITAEDPLPIAQGSPGLYAYSPVEVQFDNVKVTVSE